jgi:hypothetical protein
MFSINFPPLQKSTTDTSDSDSNRDSDRDIEKKHNL